MSKRNIEIKVRLNRKEAEILNKRVKKSRLSREAYLRHLIEGVVPQDSPPPNYYSMMRELHGIANNLNQIAQKAHVLNIVLSHDDENAFYHTPDKTLIFVVHPPKGREIHNKEDYDNFYSINPGTLSLADTKFEKLGDSVILNDYEMFIVKSVHRILSI